MNNKKPAVFLTAHWENLLMINYEVDPMLLQRHVPAGCELDLFKGKALVSVVGFMFNNTKLFGINWPWHTHFEEVNLRFYVKHFDGEVWKRGVVFKKEIVPRKLIAFFANFFYKEQYQALPMAHIIINDGKDLVCNYTWKYKHKWNKLAVVAESKLTSIEPGTEAEFILEHYWGYNSYDKSTTIEYGVEHNTWQIHKVKKWEFDCDIAGVYGNEFVPYLNTPPVSVFLAKGSPVVIRRPRKIAGSRQQKKEEKRRVLSEAV
ncbi:MAG: hypothetical protein JWQ96_1419 [Segetibacter sp.]|nr:hypothetical protein [Segetibacter sp.]